jgi:hypothetical protein
MSDTTSTAPPTIHSRIDHVLPTLTPAQIARVASHIKRVASADGEGSISVAIVHQVLHE